MNSILSYSTNITLVTVILFVFALFSAFVTMTIPVSARDPELPPAEAERDQRHSEIVFGRRRMYFRMTTMLTIFAVIASQYGNMTWTAVFAAASVASIVLYATVLNDAFAREVKAV